LLVRHVHDEHGYSDVSEIIVDRAGTRVVDHVIHRFWRIRISISIEPRRVLCIDRLCLPASPPREIDITI
jgi:hypothetical protein